MNILSFKDALKTDLEKIRSAFESIDKSNLPVTFKQFPKGSCGDTCEVLAEYLKDLGYGDFKYISGKLENGDSHAWILQNGIIIDITSDQFCEISTPVYFGPANSWYNQFDIQSKHTAGYENLDPRSKAALLCVHSKIVKELNT